MLQSEVATPRVPLGAEAGGHPAPERDSTSCSLHQACRQERRHAREGAGRRTRVSRTGCALGHRGIATSDCNIRVLIGLRHVHRGVFDGFARRSERNEEGLEHVAGLAFADPDDVARRDPSRPLGADAAYGS